MRLAAVAYEDNVYTSVDGGESWQKTSAGPTRWQSITSSSDGLQLIAVVEGGFIWSSQDGGETWTQNTSVEFSDWSAVSSSDDGVQVVAAASTAGALYTSSDAGETWTEVADSVANWQGVAVSSDGSTTAAIQYDWVTGEDGLQGFGSVWVSTDSGTTWEAADVVLEGTTEFQSISMSADGSTIAATNYNGPIYWSDDGGESWEPVTALGSRPWRDIDVSSDGSKLAAVVLGGDIYTSNTAGATFERVDNTDFGGQQNWRSVAISGDGSQIIAASVDGDHIWKIPFLDAPVPAPTMAPAPMPTPRPVGTGEGDITIPPSEAPTRAPSGTPDTTAVFLYAAEEVPELNWRSIATSSDNSVRVAVIDGGGIWRSVDNSAWAEIVDSPQQAWTSVTMSADGTKAAAVGTNTGIWVSEDSGATWSEALGSEPKDWTGITSSESFQLLAAVADHIYLSSDGGETWAASLTQEENWAGIIMSSDGTRLAAIVNGGNLWLSLNAGASWDEVSDPADSATSTSRGMDRHLEDRPLEGTKDWTTVSASSDFTTIAAAASGDYIYVSRDSGVTWTGAETVGAPRNWSAVAVSPDGSVLAAAVQGGNIWLSDDAGATWSEDATSFGGPQNFKSLAMSASGLVTVVAEEGGTIWTFFVNSLAPTPAPSEGPSEDGGGGEVGAQFVLAIVLGIFAVPVVIGLVYLIHRQRYANVSKRPAVPSPPRTPTGPPIVSWLEGVTQVVAPEDVVVATADTENPPVYDPTHRPLESSYEARP